MNTSKIVSSIAVAVASLALSAADVWYVDDDNYGKEGLDGKSLASAYGTVQAAIDMAASGDTILVSEGVYNQGIGDESGYGLSRVYIYNKKLYIKAIGETAKTVIEGKAAESGSYGCGEGAVRCMLVKGPTAAESIIEGFTFRNGFTALAATDGSTMAKSGGALCSASTVWLVNDNGPYIVGSVIENCNSPRSGISNGGTFVRCRVRNSRFNPGGYFCWMSKFLNCAIVHNYSVAADGSAQATAHFDRSTAVNCTFADNYCSFYPTDPSIVCNNLIAMTDVPVGGASNYSGNFSDSSSLRVLMGPATGDIRLRSGCSDTVKSADAAAIALIPLPSGEAPWNVDGYVDYFGAAISKEGVVAAGCSQGAGEGSAIPAGGAVILAESRMSLDENRPGHKSAYFHPVSYPSVVRIYPNAAPGTRVMWYSSTSSDYEPDKVDLCALAAHGDAVDIIPPPDADKAISVTMITSGIIKYADPKLDDYSGADGSYEKPYETIQEAIDAGTNAMGAVHHVIVVCKSGTYNKGVCEFGFNGTTGTARFVAHGGTTYRIVSEDGPEHTFIVGAPDENTANGCGPGAVTGFAGLGLSYISGFSITGCYASCKSNSGNYSTARGGSHYTYGYDLYMSDCVFADNVGTHAALGCGRYYRCKMLNNTGAHCIVGETANLFSSVVAGNTLPANKTLIAQSFNVDKYTYLAYHLSVSGNGAGSAFYNAPMLYRENCAVDEGGSSTFDSVNNYGSVYWGFQNYLGSNYLVADPIFADKASGDLRMAKVSKGVTAAVRPSSDNRWWRYCASDVNGRQIAFDAAGRPLPGAYSEAADGIYVEAPANGGVSIAGGKVGFNCASEGAELEFSAVAGPRPCAGMIVNGVTNLFEDAQNNVVTVDAAANAVISPYYTSDWYAAVDGDDSASGFYPSSAKTLKGALENVHLKSGDRVLACAGTYESGTMAQDQDNVVYVRSRAVVPSGVTLESKDGREVTIIKGQAATVEDEGSPEGWGLGEDAVRCVILRNGAKLKGFTLRDGHTRGIVGESGTDLNGGPETTGGGVGGYNGLKFGGKTDYGRNTSWMEDCIVENCSAHRGGGNMAVKSKNCIFRNNRSVYIGAGSSDTSLYGCCFYGNVSKETYALGRGCGFAYYAENCTFLDGFSTCGQYGTFGAVNCLVAGAFDVGSVAAANITNCIFASDATHRNFTDAWKAAIADNGSFAATLAELQCSADGRPIVGANKAIDRGDAASTQTYSTDAGGGQRIYNGVMDIGAMEADWRPVYAKKLAAKRLQVAEASANVVEGVEKSVLVPAGERIVSVWKGLENGDVVVYSVGVKAGGDATLAVYLNGEKIDEVSGGEKTIEFRSALPENTLSFECSGETGTGELYAFRRYAKGSAIFLR